MTTLHAIVESAGPERTTREVTLEAASYDAARVALQAQVPDGGRVVWVRTQPVL